MSKRKIGWLIAAAALFVLFVSIPVCAAYPSLSESKPMYGSGWKKASYDVYSDSALVNFARKISYQQCTITKITGNAARISYKVNGTKKTGWVSLQTFIYNPQYNQQVTYTNASFRLYRRPSASAPSVKVKTYSGGISVSEKGKWLQVIFLSGGKYRLGWLKKSTFEAYVRLSMDTTTQVLANGIYTISPRNSSASALTFDDANNRFTITKHTYAAGQQFKLQQLKSNYYIMTPENTESSLALSNTLTTSAGSEQSWLLKRTGTYFYIRPKGTDKALAYSGGNVRVKKWQKVKAQQWKIRRVPATPTKETAVVFSQYDPKWGSYVYYNGPIKRTISTSGCGVVALTNAVYALNGNFINPTKIASFSAKRGHYYYMQGTSDTLYKDYAKKYGKQYDFKHSGKIYGVTKLKKHIKKGGTAIALVPGHYIAITAYRASDNSYLVLDSAVYNKRPTTISGDWVSASTLTTGVMKCEYFHLFSRR